MHFFSTGCPSMSFTIVVLFYSTLIIEKQELLKDHLETCYKKLSYFNVSAAVGSRNVRHSTSCHTSGKRMVSSCLGLL